MEFITEVFYGSLNRPKRSNINIDQEKNIQVMIWALWKEPQPFEPFSKCKNIFSLVNCPQVFVIWLFLKKERKGREIYNKKDHHFRVRKKFKSYSVGYHFRRAANATKFKLELLDAYVIVITCQQCQLPGS